MRIVQDDADGRRAAIAVLRSGGVVALPTDTVYGIAVALDTPDGLERLFHVKHRPPDKAIALLLADPAQAAVVGTFGARARRLAELFWPGPLTMVLPARGDAPLPAALSGGSPTVGVRLPDHPVPRAFAAAVGPLPTTSANLSGAPDSVDVAGVVAALGSRVDLVLDGGRTRGSVPSTVVDLSVDPPVIRREGAVSGAQIAQALRDLPFGAM